MQGRIQKYHSNYYYVDVDGVLYECFLKGLLKKARKQSTGQNSAIDDSKGVLVGDIVTLDRVDTANRTARIGDVIERQNALSRPKIANVDQALVVYPIKQPDFDPTQLDRFLTHIALSGIPAMLCLSKTDLATPEELAAILFLYRDQLGFNVQAASIYQPDTLTPVLALLKNKVTVLAGPSGAGKSSLLNALDASLQLKVSAVSDKIERGQHTTRHVELLPIAPVGTFIADTPGFSYLKFDRTLPQTLAKTYPEFSGDSDCAYDDCLHLPINALMSENANSPNPNVPATEEESTEKNPLSYCRFLNADALAPDLETIAQSRYDSYWTMMQEALSYKQAAQQSSSKEAFGFKQMSAKNKKNMAILRLDEKSREGNRRVHRQQLSQMDYVEHDLETGLEAQDSNKTTGSDTLSSEPDFSY